MDATPEDARLLLIDTCGSPAEIALAEGSLVVSGTSLQDRTASALSLTAIRDLLAEQSWELTSLDAIGIVNGPGSFTGVRIGMALAKGLCEALELPLTTMSRLQLLQEAAATPSVFAALDAGREEVYVRSPEGKEYLRTMKAFAAAAAEHEVAVMEAKLFERLAGFTQHIRVSPVHASLANGLQHFLRELTKPNAANVLSEPHYVRGEAAIYQTPARKSKA